MYKKQVYCRRGHIMSPANVMVSGDGKRRWCKICRNETKRVYRKIHDNEKLGRARWKTASRYGLTLEEYEILLKSQKGLCALCGEKFIGSGHEPSAPALDHDHATDKIRKFIHNHCNRVLGQACDSVDFLKKCIDYLERHKEK